MTNSPARRRFLRQAAGTVTVSSTFALTACGGSDGDDGPSPLQVAFQHGVASGDPLAERVVLWTRVTPSRDEDVDLTWEISTDERFTTIAKTGRVLTNATRDFTAKVDVEGLTPGTVYWYRFSVGDTRSPVGRTRTLPKGDVGQVKLAVFSCSNFPAGYFHVYAEAARRNDLDAAIHLGDYIYEYARDGYASDRATELGRESQPTQEIVTLADYRQRYAQYRGDADLQAVHAALPFIAVWDDHEIANDTWMEGAENHQPDTEGDFALRMAAAVKAYHEWMPTREQSPLNRLYRSFDFGNLLSLHMLDTRVIGRDEQLTYPDYFGALLGNPNPAAGLQEFLASFSADAGAPNRQLLGTQQVQWLQQQLQASTATWQVLGQQVLMGPVHLPLPVLLGLLSAAGQLGNVQIPPQFQVDPVTYVTLLRRAQANDPTLTVAERTTLALPCVPYNLDSWDGYWAARETVLGMARMLDKNLVVLAGDTHNAWASDLRDREGRAIGVELATSSVSSPGFEDYLGGDTPPDQLAALVQGLANLNTLPAGNRWAGSLKYADTSLRGYMVVTATHHEVRADWHYVNTVFDKTYAATHGKTLRVLPGAGNRVLVP